MNDLRLFFLALFAAGFFLCVFQEINISDESWFLQVVKRVTLGEVLYRDVYLGVTPLSIYIPALFCSIFGIELLVVRGCLALYFALGGILIFQALKELGVQRIQPLLLASAFLAFSQCQASWGLSGYNGLAKVCFLAVFVCLLKTLRAHLEGRESKKWLAWAGISAALCIGSKQNVGAIASFCVVAALFLKIKKREFFWFCGPLCAALILLALPTVFSGGWDSFMDYAIWNKKRYLTLTHNTYFLEFPSVRPYPLFITIAPFLAAVGLALSYFWIEKKERVLWGCLCIFFVGALLALFPRPDNHQKLAAIPFFLIAIIYSYSAIAPARFPRLHRFFIPVLGSWLIFGATYHTVYASLRPWVKGRAQLSHLAPFSGIVADKECLERWSRLKRDFIPPKEGTYFFSLHTGFYFLLFDLQNPIPFDLPFHSALGCRGEEQIPKWVEEGRIVHVIRDHPSRSKWESLHRSNRPFALEAFVEQKMVKANFENIFEVYEFF